MIQPAAGYTKLEVAWKSIPGFFDFEEVYGHVANWVQEGDTLVEIGCFLGRSACWLGEQLQALGKNVNLICVDEWPTTYERRPGTTTELEAPFETFLANVRQSGLLDIIVPVRSKSVRAATFIKDGLNFVFIDGCHEYEAVRSDIEAWLPKLDHGGIIAGHDYTDNFPGVKKAVNERFPSGIVKVGACWVYPGRNRWPPA